MTHVVMEGLEFVEKQLSVLFPRETKNVMRQSTAEIARNIRDDMRANAPRLKGILKKAIVSNRAKGSKVYVGAEVRITKGRSAKHDAFYWHMVEYGTVHSAAKPFIGPAVAKKRETYKRDLSDILDRRIVKMLNKRAKKQALKK